MKKENINSYIIFYNVWIGLKQLINAEILHNNFAFLHPSVILHLPHFTQKYIHKEPPLLYI